MATLHLICGLPCSGKSTYARALQADANCVLLVLDRWLISAFGKYELTAVGQEEHTRRVLACRELMWEAVAELLRRSVDVILDDGFFLRHHRVRQVALAEAVGASATIHHIDTPLDVIRARLAVRNAQLPAFNFRIDPEALVGFSGLFEPPSKSEGAEVLVIRDPDFMEPQHQASDQLREDFALALEAAADAQEAGDLAAIEVGYDELDGLLPRNGDPRFAKLHVALRFWDGWIDSRNHDWLYYEGLQAGDWPGLARGVARRLRDDMEIVDPRVLRHL